MSSCPFCGAKIEPKHKFCSSCGKKLPTSERFNLPFDPRAFALFSQGANLQQEGKIEEAIECYDAALKISPNAKEIIFSKQLALQLLESDDRYIRKRIMRDKPESQQKLLKIYSDIVEIINTSLNDFPSYKEEISLNKED